MLDFNHSNPAHSITLLIDAALEKKAALQAPRSYLGASLIGHDCDRFLQYEFFNCPVEGPKFPGRVLRIFEFGHVIEEMAIKWFRLAGFNLKTEKPGGEQFGFETMNGRFAGHVDGVFVEGGPDVIPTPALWECKSMGSKYWKQCNDKGVAESHPQYAAQIAVYQAYLQLTDNPAIFTAVNKDTCDLLHQEIPFNPRLAQDMSDRAVRVVQACDTGELLSRVSNDPSFYKCKFCNHAGRCHA